MVKTAQSRRCAGARVKRHVRYLYWRYGFELAVS